MSYSALLLYPHQLYAAVLGLGSLELIVLVEDPLFFQQYRFHKQKLLLHRASMMQFKERLEKAQKKVIYVESSTLKATEDIANELRKFNVSRVVTFELVDDWLEQKLRAALHATSISFETIQTPGFLSSVEWGKDFFKKQGGKYFMASFYVEQRKRLGILLQGDKPTGGRWSFDAENRKRLPKTSRPPHPFRPEVSKALQEAKSYVEARFSDNPGSLDQFYYPTTHSEATQALTLFFQERFVNYGAYQDAIDLEDSFLFHSVLSPALNTGLLTPRQVVDAALEAFETGQVPLNSVEGFIRQIIGWREYVRIVYELIGRKQRTRNFFDYDRALPGSFWSGETGMDPVDGVIARLLRTGYSNHIERLMVLSNFMLLAEYHPDQVYEWFMSMYIDAYDWVMVPNVYGMSLFSDGGMITTKPYVSSSNYLRKMSWYKKGNWCDTWDGLYWSFIAKHRSLLEENHRMRMIIGHLDRMGEQKLREHKALADRFHLSVGNK